MQASLVQRQRLGLKMSPQMYQAIKLMELPLVDLREKVSEELQRNPALELVEDRSEVSLSSGESRPEKGDGDRYPSTGRKAAVSSDEYRRFMEGVPTRPETLQQHLLWQLRLEPTDAGVKAVAETLIQNLDDDGFHREPPASLFPRTDPKTLEAAMALVRGLDPVGCCTADFRESLRAQIALLGESPGCEECPLDPLRLLERGRTAL
ncbi:MAG: RNA polymerase sigma-54 factor, partial [Treponema sp.]|nr:RNA polymerase sigma-54 factor [Treponema sp.]